MANRSSAFVLTSSSFKISFRKQILKPQSTNQISKSPFKFATRDDKYILPLSNRFCESLLFQRAEEQAIDESNIKKPEYIAPQDPNMCFYNQKKFSCGDWNWTNFAQQCNYEYRTGETCGMRLVNSTEYEAKQCRLCEKIETKFRRRSQELERLDRWRREGGSLVATISRSQQLVNDLENEICQLQIERDSKRKALS